MMKKQDEQRPKLAPKLRFKGFTNDWEQRKLKDITEKISERNTDNHYQNVFTNSALHGIINQTDYFDRNIANSTNLTNYYVVQKDNFIYNPRISSNAPYGPINRNKLNQVGVMSPLYLVFENRLASHDFLEYYFFSSKWYRYMLKVGNTGARSDRYAIKNKDFFNMPIFIPEYNEQCKVGNILKVLNKTITLHNKKLELYQKYKQSIKNTILQNKLRLKEDNTPWQSLTIGDIGKTISGTGFPEKEQGGNTGIPFFKVSDMNINDNHKVMQKSTNYITESQVQQNKWKVIETKNSYIIFAKVGAAIYLERKRLVFNNFLIDNNLMALEIAENFDSEFIYTLINNISFSRFARVGALPSFNSSDIENIRVYIPNKEIQSKYGNLFKKLDQHEVYIDNKVKKLMTFKAYLLEHLFI